ncbi:MAG: hypothetical protein LC623_05420 [Halobacteriales archaeon]|nr:hypothetical protein [Halobacteriales archaeon]
MTGRGPIKDGLMRRRRYYSNKGTRYESAFSNRHPPPIRPEELVDLEADLRRRRRIPASRHGVAILEEALASPEVPPRAPPPSPLAVADWSRCAAVKNDGDRCTRPGRKPLLPWGKDPRRLCGLHHRVRASVEVLPL